MTGNGMIEAFRSERQLDDRGIQGIHPLRHSRNLLSGIQRLLLREAFSPSVVFYFFMFFVFSGFMRGQRPLIVDRTIQG